MWASLPSWLLGDGQIEELGVDDVIHDCGLRLNCARLNASDKTQESVDEAPMNASGQVRYQLVGRCEAVTGPMASLIGMPGWLTVAEPETHRVVSRRPGAPAALQPWSVDFNAPSPGQMVEAEGWLQVVAEHEWAFPIPDSRMDWRIRGIRLLRHRMVPTSDKETDVFTFGPVLKVTEHERLDAKAEWLSGAHYVLDLVPA